MTAYTDFHYSPTGSGVISGAQVLEQTEQGINGLGQYVQDNVSGAIDTANEALTTARNADSNATAALNLANSFNAQIIAANQTAGNALTTAQSAQNTANAASSLATTANNNAATALNTANAASSAVTTLTGTVNSLGNRMTAAENAINANAGNITTLQNNLATTNANVTAAANAASSAQATATSAQSTATLARNQAYVLRYTGTTITGGGTIAYADIDNTDNIKAGDKIIDISGAIYDIASVDTANQTVTVGASPVINLFCDAENLIPAANDAYDLGSASKQWLNTYSKGYYYNGVAWGVDKANVWSAANTYTYSLGLKQTNLEEGELPASNQTRRFTFTDKNNASLGWLQHRVNTSGDSYLELLVTNKFSNGQLSTQGNEIINSLVLGLSSDGLRYLKVLGDVYPDLPGRVCNLGTSTNKWKTLNGVNPGALSLPSDNPSSVNLDPTNWNTTGSGFNSYIPPSDGWLGVQVKSADATDLTGQYVFVGRSTGGNDYWSQGSISVLKMLDNPRLVGQVFIPVRSGNTYFIRIKINKTQTEGSIILARFYPCEGNV